jgi:WD40 repeat protein
MCQKPVIACLCSCLLTFAGWASADDKITFDDHIKPIFREHCLSCHNANEKKSDLALDTYAATLEGGSGGEIVSAGDLDSSRLWELVAHVAQPYMPPNQDRLADAKLELIKQWIEQGMPENSGSVIKKKNTAAAAMLSSASTGKPDGPPPMPEKLFKQPTLYTDRSAAIAAMAASPWAPLVAVGGQMQVCLYHSESGEMLGILPFPEGEPQCLQFTRDGRQLLIGGGRHGHSGCAVLVDIASGERITKVGDEIDVVLAADITPDKKYIAFGGPQKIVKVYDSQTGDLVHELKKHTDWIYALRYSPDGVLLASGDRSNGLVVWEADSGRLYADLVGHRSEIRALDFRPDSNVLASASLDGTVKLWGMLESNLQRSFDAHAGGVTALAFAQNGSLATTGRDRKTRLWAADGNKSGEFDGLTEVGLKIAVTGEATHVAAGDWNGQVRLWTVADASQVKELRANPLPLPKVIELAQADAAAVQAEFLAVSDVANKAATALAATESELSEVTKTLTASQEQIAAFEQSQQKLNEDMKNQDAVIADLEAQLAAMKKSREETLVALATTAESLKKYQEIAEAAAGKQATVKAQQAELAASHAAAAAQLAEAGARQQAAQAAVANAEAEWKAFQEHAQSLKEEAEKVAAAAAAAEQQLVAKTKLEAEKVAEMDSMKAALAELQAELETLQQKLAAATAAQGTAEAELAATRSTAEQLKAAFETAQQEAQEAAERLQLFQEAYRD